MRLLGCAEYLLWYSNQPALMTSNDLYSPLSMARRNAVYTLLMTNGDSRSRMPVVRMVPLVGLISNQSAGSLSIEYLFIKKK